MVKKEYIQKCLNDFNRILSQYCNGVIEHGELHALAGWVNQACLDDLNATLGRYLINGNKVRFMLAWIDKSPIAEYRPSGASVPINGELADVAIIRLLVHSKSTAIAQAGRMLLLQAKATKSPPPFVPSTIASGATPKEWAFMTSWPPFKLRTWRASSHSTGDFDVMQGVAQADRTEKMHQMSWFGVTPFYPTNKGQWAKPPFADSPWWTAPPVSGRQCNTALSKLLLKIALNSKVIDASDADGAAGREFQFTKPSLTLTGASTPLTWDDLANEIIDIAANNAPASQQVFATSRVIQFLTDTLTPISQPTPSSCGKSLEEKPFPVIFVTHIE